MNKLLLLTLISASLCASHYTDLEIRSLEQKAASANANFIDFIFSDIHGNIRNVTQPIDYLKSVFKYGTTFDGSSMPGYATISASDLMLIPDSNSFTIINGEQNVTSKAFVLCNIYETDNTPFEGSPRFVLQQALDRAENMGYDFLVGPELEFFVFNQDGTPCDSQQYFCPEKDKDLRLLRQNILSLLQKQNIPVEKLHHEVAPGQHEISIHYDNALKVADNIVLAKHTISSLAQEHGLKATFMPKPIYGENGSGMHIHFSLYDYMNEQNIFADPDGQYNLSQTARHFIAGVLYYAKDIAALLNPTINSYKRLVPGYEAPTNICWGTKNRSAMIRIPYVASDMLAGVRAEIRCPDASCNPYLAFAAILHAGLQGVEEQLDLSSAINKSLYTMDEEQLFNLSIDSLPGSLQDALNYLKESTIAETILGNHLYTQFINLKERELFAFNTAVTDWEINHYQ